MGINCGPETVIEAKTVVHLTKLSSKFSLWEGGPLKSFRNNFPSVDYI